MVIAIGVLLVIAAFRGGARWLIVPALALALPLGAVAAADVSFDGGVGERTYEPTTVAAIPDDGYELGVGQLNVDLRSLEWNPNTVVELPVDLGIGQLNVAVPESVCVTGDLDVSRRRDRGRRATRSAASTPSTSPRTGRPRRRASSSTARSTWATCGSSTTTTPISTTTAGRSATDPSRDEMRETMEAACAIDEPEPAAREGK